MRYPALIAGLLALAAGQVLAQLTRGSAKSSSEENDNFFEHSWIKRDTNGMFRNFLETDLKTILREGNASLGIPPLDPYEGQLLELDINEDYLKGNLTLMNFTVEGLVDYNVDDAEISTWHKTITVGLRWPRIYSNGSYELDCNVTENDMTIFGEGKYIATFSNVTLHTKMTFKTRTSVSISNMDTSVSLGALSLSATGLLNDTASSTLLSNIISEMTPQLIQDYQSEITSSLNAQFMTVANEKLKGISWLTLIAIIS